MERDYAIRFTGDSAKFVSEADRVLARLRQIENELNRIRPKLNDLFAAPTTQAEAYQKAVASAARSQLLWNQRAEMANQIAAQLATSMGVLQQQSQGVNGRIRAGTVHTREWSDGFGVLSARMLALAAGYATVRSIADALKEARDLTREAAEDTIKWKEGQRELAATLGKSGPDQVSKQQQELMLATGATAQEATAFDTLWESSVPASRKQIDPATGKPMWTLSPEQEKQVKVSTLRFALAKGIDPRVMAETVGSMGVNQRVDSPQAVMAEMASAFHSTVEGRGQLSEIYKSAQRIRPALIRPDGVSAFRNDAELYAALGAATNVSGSPVDAAGLLEKTWRFSSRPQAKQLGIDQRGGMLGVLRGVQGLLQAGQAQGKSDIETLTGLGFTAKAEAMSMSRLVRALPVMEQDTAKIAAFRADPSKVTSDVDAFFAGDRAGQARLGAARAFVGQRKLGEQVEGALPFQEAAAGLLMQRGELGTPGQKFLDRITNMLSLGMDEDAEKYRLNVEIQRHIASRLPEVGRREGIVRDDGQASRPRNTQELTAILGRMSPEERMQLQISMGMAVTSNLAGGVGAQGPRPDLIGMGNGFANQFGGQGAQAGDAMPGGFPVGVMRGPGGGAPIGLLNQAAANLNQAAANIKDATKPGAVVIAPAMGGGGMLRP